MNYEPVDADQIAEALGDISQLPKDMQMTLTTNIDESFQPIPTPDYWSWLNHHVEEGQSIESFKERTSKAVPHGTNKTIYIQPIGSFDHPRVPSLDIIVQFVRVFFSGCDVELLPIIEFTDEMIHRINNGTKQIQYRTDGFYDYLKQTRTQRDTNRELVCVAVTMVDIYPKDDWNFVYGQARAIDHAGIYSFARLDPFFPMPLYKSRNIRLTNEHRKIILRRSMKILLHELGHLFGLKHCIYYICLMNAANNEIEMDRQTLYLCPICLHKLYSTLQFDVRSMYNTFADLCEKYGLEQDGIWYRQRLGFIQE